MLRLEKYEERSTKIKGSELSLLLFLSAHFPGSASLLEGNIHRQNKMILRIFNAYPSTTAIERHQKLWTQVMMPQSIQVSLQVAVELLHQGSI